MNFRVDFFYAALVSVLSWQKRWIRTVRQLLFCTYHASICTPQRGLQNLDGCLELETPIRGRPRLSGLWQHDNGFLHRFSLFTSYKNTGIHAGESYYDMDLTIVLNRRSIKSNYRCVKHCLLSPTHSLALEIINILWFFGLRSFDMVMLGYVWLLTGFKGKPYNVYSWDMLLFWEPHTCWPWNSAAT